MLRQPFDRIDIGAEILVDQIIGGAGVAARRGMRRGDAAQEVVCRFAEGGGGREIEPHIFDQRKPHAAPQRRLGIGLAMAQLAGSLGRLFIERAVLAKERSPFPQRRGVGQLLKAREIIAPLLFLRRHLRFVFDLRRRFQPRGGDFLPDIIRHQRQRQGQHAAPQGDTGQAWW